MSTPTPLPSTPASTVAGTASPAPQPAVGADPIVSILTLIAALIAAAVAAIGVYFQRKSGRESAVAAKSSAEASHKSSDAAQLSAASSDRSSRAAVDAVAVNAETAAGVARRAHADALATRYQDAAAQLGHAKSPVRLAGVYALARLADDWKDDRQTCVDVLCAYLRMPWPDSAKEPTEYLAEAAVRRAIALSINSRLLVDAAISWSNLSFDFSGAHLVGFELTEARFSGYISFLRTTFGEGNAFRRCIFDGKANFNICRVEGDLAFWECTLGDTHLRLLRSFVTDTGHLSFHAIVAEDGATPLVNLGASKIDGILNISAGIGSERVRFEMDATSIRGRVVIDPEILPRRSTAAVVRDHCCSWRR
jgi:hypothetical protein